VLRRFWAKVDVLGPDECWSWLAYTKRGYGSFWVKPKNWPAHVFGWMIFHQRPFPAGLYGCHACDNPVCVNPRHIWPGTQGQNLADCFEKGRRPAKVAAPEVAAHRAKIMCKRGHPLTPENTRKASNGGRRCAICSNINLQEWRARRRGGEPRHPRILANSFHLHSAGDIR
jgi:hypothetical protein